MVYCHIIKQTMIMYVAIHYHCPHYDNVLYIIAIFIHQTIYNTALTTLIVLPQLHYHCMTIHTTIIIDKALRTIAIILYYHYSHTIIIIDNSYIIIPTHKALLYSTNHYRGTKLS